MQGGTNVTRMDYLSALLNNELVVSMPRRPKSCSSIDEDIPERADVDPHAACRSSTA